MYQGRGVLTPRIEKLSKKLLGYKITEIELRLMCYVQFVMVNEQRIKMEHCNKEDRDILAKWKENKYIEGGASGLSMTEEFWNTICKIIFLGYVDID